MAAAKLNVVKLIVQIVCLKQHN